VVGLVAWLASILFYGTRIVVSAEVLSPSQYVDGYSEYLRLLRTLSFEFEYSTFERGGHIGADERLIGRSFGSLSVRGDEYRFRRRSRYELWREGRFNPYDSDIEEVITSDRQVHLQADYPTLDATFNLDGFPDAGARFSVATWERNKGIKVEQLDYMLHALYGYLPFDGDISLASILLLNNDATVTSNTTLDGHDVKRIVGHSNYGRYSLWLDLTAGFVPRRIESHKTDESLFAGKQLSQSPKNNDVDGRHPLGQIHEYNFDVGMVELAIVPGTQHTIMSSFEIVETKVYDNGERFSHRLAVKLSNVRFECSDADLKPVLAAPDGTSVYFNEAPSLKGEWRQGAVVKLVDQDSLRRFEGLSSSGDTNTNWGRRGWLIALNVVAVLVLLYFWTVRRVRTS
jgi:hypothetical protein